MAFLLKLKAYAWWLGAAILSILAVIGRLKMLEHQRDKARHRAHTAEARVHINKVEKEIEKKEKESLQASLKEVEEKVKEKEFEGLDNLSDPNNF